MESGDVLIGVAKGLATTPTYVPQTLILSKDGSSSRAACCSVVNIASAMAHDPSVLLMDEPFSSLDAPTRESLQNLPLELQKEQNLTLVIVTHAIEEAAVIGENILLLDHPPNRTPQVIEHRAARQPDFRHTSDFIESCRDLRSRMEAD